MALLSATSSIYWIGDSVTATFGSFGGTASVLPPVGVGIRQAFVADASLFTPASAQVLPKIARVNAVAGRAYRDISSSIAASLAATRRTFTHIVIQLGINDADLIRLGTITLGQFTADFDTVVAACLATGAKVVLIGPWAHDSGDDAVQIAQVDAVMLAKAAADPTHITYVRWSNITNGGGNSIADGTHPTTQGALALSVPVVAALCT